jgi:DNA-binding NtrC family response regulator
VWLFFELRFKKEGNMATILLLDDCEELSLCVRILNVCGHTCYPFDSAQAVLKRVLIERPDLVVINPHLPDGEGMRALKALKEFDSNLPVVLYTSASLFGDSCGYFIADGVLGKQAKHTQLISFVESKFGQDTGAKAKPFHELYF